MFFLEKKIIEYLKKKKLAEELLNNKLDNFFMDRHFLIMISKFEHKIFHFVVFK